VLLNSERFLAWLTCHEYFNFIEGCQTMKLKYALTAKFIMEQILPDFESRNYINKIYWNKL
jgi:hypothetical protein